MKKEKLINKGLDIFIGRLKKFAEEYLFHSKLQRQTKEHGYLVKRLTKMSKEKIKRWSNDRKNR